MTRTILLILIASQSAFGADTLVSDEALSVSVRPGGIECRDEIKDHGFGGAPASVYVDPKNLIDPTYRARGVWLSAELLSGEDCSRVAMKLRKAPSAFSARRVLQREDSKPVLKGEISLPIPELGIVLRGEKSWLEAPIASLDPGAPGQNRAYLPERGYSVDLDLSLSLRCIDRMLTVEGIAGGESNVTEASREFATAGECETARSGLLKDSESVFTLRVTRSISTEYRRLSYLKRPPTCDEVQVDSVSTEIQGVELRGKEIFPIRSVEISKCSAN